MKHLNHTIDFEMVSNFIQDFHNEFPHLWLLITEDEVANYLAQPHIHQYDKTASPETARKFKLNLFADWVQANQLVEVSF